MNDNNNKKYLNDVIYKFIPIEMLNEDVCILLMNNLWNEIQLSNDENLIQLKSNLTIL